MGEEKRNISATTGTYDPNTLTVPNDKPDTRFGGVLLAIDGELSNLESIYLDLNRITAPVQEQNDEPVREREDRIAGETQLEDELLATLDRIRVIVTSYRGLQKRIQP